MKIQTENISKVFNSHYALKNINLQISPKITTAIIGPNGAGKTTLLKIINMIEPPTSGEIYYDDIPLSKLSPKEKLNFRRQMVYLNQYPIVFSTTVLKNLEYGLKIRKVYSNEIRKTCKLLQIEHLINKFAKDLSYGEKQRVAIARALIINPETLLLDEPTNNLDPISTKIVENLIEKLQRAEKTILITAHNLLFARKFTQYAYFIQNGTIVQSGKTEEIFSKPISIQTAEFTGTQNIIKGKLIDNSTFAVDNINLSIVGDNSFSDKETYVTIQPEDILISNQPVSNTSARNCIKGKIQTIASFGQIEEVKVKVSENLILTAVITKSSKEEMQLYPNKEVYVVFKATAVHVVAV